METRAAAIERRNLENELNKFCVDLVSDLEKNGYKAETISLERNFQTSDVKNLQILAIIDFYKK